MSELAPNLGPSGLTLTNKSLYKSAGTLVNGAQASPIGSAYAANLDGTNDHVVMALSAAVLAALNSNLFSVSLWVYVRSFSASPVVWSVQTNASLDSCVIEFNATGSQLYVRSGNNTSGSTGLRTYTLSSTIATNTWCHICFVKTGTGDNGNLYVNGVLQTSYSGTFNTCVVTTSQSMYYGIYFTVVPLNGAVDSMMIHDRPLLPSVVNLLRLKRGIAYEQVPRRSYNAIAGIKGALIGGRLTRQATLTCGRLVQ